MLQVTPRREPSDESPVINIWLAALTAVVFTTRVEPPVAITTLPADAEPHKAGETGELQFPVVEDFPQEIVPGTVVVVAGPPTVIAVAFVVPMLSMPAAIVSINAPICRNRFPAVRVILEPSSENRESPRF